MNNYCQELNFSKDLYPKIDLSKYSTDGYTWATFHKILSPLELNNNYLLVQLGIPNIMCISFMVILIKVNLLHYMANVFQNSGKS